MEMMDAFVYYGVRDIRREKRPRPELTRDGVIVRVARVGVCGSDIHYFMDGHVGNSVPRAPYILGHEISGDIVEVGSEVKGFAPGDRVIIEPTITCGFCVHCRRGRYNLCLHNRTLGSASATPHPDGGFADFVGVPARNCFRLPEGVTHQEGALVEPLAVGTHAVNLAGGVGGKRVLITGAGTIGQTVLANCRAMGAVKVAVTDISDFTRSFALAHGADTALNPQSLTFDQEMKDFGGDGFDIVFEASGAVGALQQGLEYARRGATIVQIGTLPEKVTLALNNFMSKEIRLVGSFRYANVFDVDLEMISNRRFALNDLVTHVFPFDETLKAIEIAIGRNEVMKVQIAH